MKEKLTAIFLFGLLAISYAQDKTPDIKPYKGSIYFYWGWNRAGFSNSDIQFKGDDYDFTLNDVRAKDRQTAVSADIYLHPKHLTIPQYNVRVGYYLTDHYSISVGTDHMKYVMVTDQRVKINGRIGASGNDYEGIYDNEDIVLTEDFLTFEHTDGLNYVNVDARRHDVLKDFSFMTLSLQEGIGLGLLYPKTNAKLMSNERYDQFHISGYGVSGFAALNFEFFNFLFIQSELKGGYVNMPKIRTTPSKSDSASQSFFYYQYNILFGARIGL